VLFLHLKIMFPYALGRSQGQAVSFYNELTSLTCTPFANYTGCQLGCSFRYKQISLEYEVLKTLKMSVVVFRVVTPGS
jgi:hypothetical protein